jgi:Tol biopolymer transport system component
MIRFWVWCVMMAALGVALLMGAAKMWGAAFPSPMLAYTSDDFENTRLEVLDLNTRRIDSIGVVDLSVEFYPSWSSDGRLAFVPERDGFPEIYVWDISGVYKVSPDETMNSVPLWSVDGKLSFWSRRDGNSDIYVWHQDTLINISQGQNGGWYTTWSSDGRLALVLETNGNYEVYVWNGLSLNNISQHSAVDDEPVWSADGIYVWDGDSLTNVSQTLTDDTAPVWSNNGQIVFFSDHQVYVWNGNSTERITNEARNYGRVVWGENGHLAFCTDMYADGDILVWNGTTLTNLGQINSRSIPQWSAYGRLVFISGRDGYTNSTIVVWNGVTLTNVNSFPFIDSIPRWSRNGWLAFAEAHPYPLEIGADDIYVWDGENSQSINPPYTDATDFIWNYDGSLLALAVDPNIYINSSNTDLYLWDESELVQLTYAQDRESPLAWWPVGE